MPTILLDGVEFKNLSEDMQIQVLNSLVGVAYMRGIVSHTERKKCFERAKKLLDKINK